MSVLDAANAIEALDKAPWGVMILREDRIIWVNARFSETLQISGEKLSGLSLSEPSALSGLTALFDKDSEELALELSNGETRRLRRWRPALLSNGAEVHYFEDVTELLRLEEERDRLQLVVKTLDTKDPETGLLSQNAILQALENQISRSRRYGNLLSVVRLTLAPPLGTEEPQAALRAISQEFNAQLRWADQIGRLDPTTFLLILPETSLNDAEELALKLGHDRVALASRAQGWTLGLAATAWRKGDDARKLLARLHTSPA